MKLYTEIKPKSSILCNILKKDTNKCNFKAKYLTFENIHCCGNHLDKSLSHYIKNKDVECSICYSKIKGKHFYKLHCDHFFHENCIKPWIDKRNSCPLCRKVVDEKKPSGRESIDIQISVLINFNAPIETPIDNVIDELFNEEITTNLENQILQLEEIVDTSNLELLEPFNSSLIEIVNYLEAINVLQI